MQQPNGVLQVVGEMVSIVVLALTGRFIGFAQATKMAARDVDDLKLAVLSQQPRKPLRARMEIVHHARSGAGVNSPLALSASRAAGASRRDLLSLIHI